MRPYFPVKIGNREISVEFHWGIEGLLKKPPHPDLVALCCLVLFYPFCHGKVTFPQPVSRYLAEALMSFPLRRKINHQYQKIDAHIQACNLDLSLARYSGQYKGAEFDGDVRTSALKTMFPELWLIHQYRGTESQTSEHWISEKKFIPVKVKNLVRFTPMACLAATILLSSVLNLQTLIYSPDRSKGDIRSLDEGNSVSLGDWEKLFYEASQMTVVNYMKGLSMLTCTSLTYKGGLLRKVVFCRRKKNKECLKCFECFRHLVYFAFLGLMPIAKSDWKKYQSDQIKHDIIKLNDPEVNYCLRQLHQKGKLPNWLVPFATFPGARMMEHEGMYHLKSLGENLKANRKNELILRLKTYGIGIL